jgi:hypothetical protein
MGRTAANPSIKLQKASRRNDKNEHFGRGLEWTSGILLSFPARAQWAVVRSNNNTHSQQGFSKTGAGAFF